MCPLIDVLIDRAFKIMCTLMDEFSIECRVADWMDVKLKLMDELSIEWM